MAIKKVSKKKTLKTVSSLELKTDRDIAMDFAINAYKKFDKMIKSIVLFGSAAKKEITTNSDIDIILIVDDVSIKWDIELIAWYREELGKILSAGHYKRGLHINTIKLSTWWEDFMRTDPVVINVIRYGETLIDYGGFFDPLKFLLEEGKIKPSPEAIYNALQRAPMHLARSRASEMASIEGIYWSMVDSAHAALIATESLPPSPEHIPLQLKEKFVDTGRLNTKYIVWFRDLMILHKRISHGEVSDLKGLEIDAWQQRAEEFLNVMAQLVDDIISRK